MKRLFYLIIFLLLALFMFSLNFKNPQLVSLNYYFGIHLEAPFVLVATAIFIVGLLLGSLFMGFSVLKNKRKYSQAERQLAKLNKELNELKTTSLKTEIQSS